MPGREPTPEDGPLFRSAHEHADAVDRAGRGARRRAAWARFIPSALVALAEGFLRDALLTGAVLFSIITVWIGLTSSAAVWKITCVVFGVVGIALVLVAVARRWSFGRQWAVILAVFVLQVGLMIAVWQTR